ncbi:MAG: signal recognition particle receptor subunit alpha, partial [Methanobacterium sp.]|nr:signal recognition particle receptor subunit alpha [Methanobacterium sp.]
MFESLKKKFSGTIGKITDKISKEEEEALKSESAAVDESGKTEKTVQKDTQATEEVKKKDIQKKDKSSRINKPWGKRKSDIEAKDESKQTGEQESEITEEMEPSDKEKSGLLSFVRHKTISEKDVDDILFELELSLLEGDVALEVAEEIINSVKEDLVGRKIKRRSDVAEFTKEALKKAI